MSGAIRISAMLISMESTGNRANLVVIETSVSGLPITYLAISTTNCYACYNVIIAPYWQNPDNPWVDTGPLKIFKCFSPTLPLPSWNAGSINIINNGKTFSCFPSPTSKVENISPTPQFYLFFVTDRSLDLLTFLITTLSMDLFVFINSKFLFKRSLSTHKKGPFFMFFMLIHFALLLIYMISARYFSRLKINHRIMHHRELSMLAASIFLHHCFILSCYNLAA